MKLRTEPNWAEKAAQIGARIDAELSGIEFLRASRAQFALAAADGDLDAQAKLDGLTEAERIAERKIGDLQTALQQAGQRVDEQRAREAAAAEEARQARVREIGKELLAVDSEADALMAKLRTPLERRAELLRALQQQAGVSISGSFTLYSNLRAAKHHGLTELLRLETGIAKAHWRSLRDQDRSLVAGETDHSAELVA